jgi:hypothetical protein
MCNYALVTHVCVLTDHLNKNVSDSEPLPVTQARIMYKSCMDTGELRNKCSHMSLRIRSLSLYV